MTLKELYNFRLNDYKLNGFRERPEKLLAMLLLSEKDIFNYVVVPEIKFYEYYKEEIDKKIAQIESDFNYTREDIKKIIEEFVVYDDYESDKILFVYSRAFELIYWNFSYSEEKTSEEVYVEYFGKFELLGIDNNNDLKLIKNK